MLKDFLGVRDDSNPCSSSGFKSFPRKFPINQEPCIRNLIEIDVNYGKYGLQRSRSKASAATISAFHAVIHAVRNIHLTKSPSILPRSLSRKLSRRNSNHRDSGKEGNRVGFRAVTIKDIMRWKSFRDLAEEKENSPPVEFASSTASTTPCSSSNGSSWCESDFTAEYLPEECGDKYLPGVGKDLTEATIVEAAESAVGPEGEWDYEDEEEEQHSPVSVLGFQDEDEEPISSFNQSLANMERTKQKLMQKIQHFEYIAKMDHANLEEWMSSMEDTISSGSEDNNDTEEETDYVEEKAKKLLDHVKGLSPIGSGMDELLLDFFREELDRYKKHGRSNEDEMVEVAKAWMDGDKRMIVGWEEEKRGIFVEDMKRGGWSIKFEEEEEEELVSEVEGAIFKHLLDEILGDGDLFLW